MERYIRRHPEVLFVAWTGFAVVLALYALSFALRGGWVWAAIFVAIVCAAVFKAQNAYKRWKGIF